MVTGEKAAGKRCGTHRQKTGNSREEQAETERYALEVEVILASSLQKKSTSEGILITQFSQ